MHHVRLSVPAYLVVLGGSASLHRRRSSVCCPPQLPTTSCRSLNSHRDPHHCPMHGTMDKDPPTERNCTRTPGPWPPTSSPRHSSLTHHTLHTDQRESLFKDQHSLALSHHQHLLTLIIPEQASTSIHQHRALTDHIHAQSR
jgi:hypothetical protein